MTWLISHSRIASNSYVPYNACMLLEYNLKYHEPNHQGPVVQSIVSLTTSLRRHLVKYIPITLSNTLLFFQQKITVYL